MVDLGAGGVRRFGHGEDVAYCAQIDAVSVLSFASLNDVEDYLVSADHAAIEASESALLGEGSEWCDIALFPPPPPTGQTPYTPPTPYAT